MRWFGLGVACLVFAGCASSWAPVPTRMDRLRSYAIGETQTVSVGEPIVAVGNVILQPGYRAIEHYVPPRDGGGERAALEPGTQFRVTGTDAAGRLRLIRPGNPQLTVILDTDGLIDMWQYGLARPIRLDDRPETPLFSQADLTMEGSFKAEIVYSGLDGQTVRATYREYVDDMARAAFFQDLNFNLAESRIIGYRTLRMEVLEATNVAITFRVLEDGGLPWLPGGS